MNMSNDFNERQRARLKMRAERLMNTLSDDYPVEYMVVNEIALLVTAATALYGPQVFTALGKSFQRYLRIDEGFCPSCLENPRCIVAGRHMCDVCESQQKKFERRHGLDDPET